MEMRQGGTGDTGQGMRGKKDRGTNDSKYQHTKESTQGSSIDHDIPAVTYDARTYVREGLLLPSATLPRPRLPCTNQDSVDAGHPKQSIRESSVRPT